MSGFDKAKDKARQAMGEAKERLGRAAGDERLENSGKRDKLIGEAKEAGYDLRDRAADRFGDLKRRFEGRDEDRGPE
jgi:uncharacterized protein YjbJ (UPF0337 family)